MRQLTHVGGIPVLNLDVWEIILCYLPCPDIARDFMPVCKAFRTCGERFLPKLLGISPQHLTQIPIKVSPTRVCVLCKLPIGFSVRESRDLQEGANVLSMILQRFLRVKA